MQKTLTRSGLDSNMLKLIAIAAMTADHIAWLLFPGYPTDPLPIILHIIGRLTCPIMCFFIAEGYHYTRNIKKYMARLFVFAVISHFAYMFASNDFEDSVLLWGYPQPDERHMVARMGTRSAADSGQRQNQNAGKSDFDSAHLCCRPACRLELHSVAERAVHRHKQGRAEKADSLVYALGCGLCRCIFLRYRQDIRADTALRRARDTAAVFV